MTAEEIKEININFIVSTGRTGSTLLATMCNMHPSMLSVTEETFPYTLFEKYKGVKTWNEETIRKYCYDFYLFSEGRLEAQFGTFQDLQNILLEHKNILDISTAIRLTYLCFHPAKDKSAVTTVVGKQLLLHSVLDKMAENYPKSKFVILLRDHRDNLLVKMRLAERNNVKVNYLNFALVWNNVYSAIAQMSRN